MVVGGQCQLLPICGLCITNHGMCMSSLSLFRCEQALISSVTVRNCIKLYQTSEEHTALKLKEYCLQIISSHWVCCSHHHTHLPVHNGVILWGLKPIVSTSWQMLYRLQLKGFFPVFRTTSILLTLLSSALHFSMTCSRPTLPSLCTWPFSIFGKTWCFYSS